MQDAKHCNGVYFTVGNCIKSKYCDRVFDKPACIVDTSTGTLHKVSNIDDVSFIKYFERLSKTMCDIGKQSDIAIFSFENLEDLSIDNICTLINFMNNHIEPEQMKQIMIMKGSQLKEFVDKLELVGL